MSTRINRLDEWSNGSGVTRDLLDAFLGPFIGSGCSRQVFEHRFRKDFVVKVETNSKSFDNIREYDIWHEVDKEVRRWLAPIEWISPCGIVMIQHRTQRPDIKVMPKRIPNWLYDTKLGNWGWYKGRIVCHDYANHCALRRGAKNVLKKADWWDETDQ